MIRDDRGAYAGWSWALHELDLWQAENNASAWQVCDKYQLLFYNIELCIIPSNDLVIGHIVYTHLLTYWLWEHRTLEFFNNIHI